MQTKARLTITLPLELLKRVDGLIDGIVMRNRSHAVEQLLRQSLEPQLANALILAGGEVSKNGTHEHPFLQKIQGKPLYVLMIDRLRLAGITEVVIAAGTHEEAFRNVLGDGTQLGVHISYLREQKALGTAGALRAARSYFKNGPCLVINGDVLTDLNLVDFLNFHAAQGTIATIAVKPRYSELKYGQAFMHGNRIVKFLDSGATEGISIVNTGIYLFDSSIFGILKPDMRSIEKDVFPELASSGELSAFIFQGLWYDISDEREKQAASNAWK